MALNTTLAGNIAKLVNLGDTVSYVARNNKKDLQTFTDERNMFEDAIKKKQILEILTAIYDMSKTSRKINGHPFAITSRGNKFMVSSVKDAQTKEVVVTLKPTVFKAYDKLTGKTTTIELGKVMDARKTEVEPLKKQLLTALGKLNTDAEIIELMHNLLNNK